MTSLRFSGLWPWWLVLIVGIVGSLLIARWYYRESQHVRMPMRWLLPMLRGLAFLLILLMLAGPILVHQTVEGQLSLIRIIVDQSGSMSTSDDNRLGSEAEPNSTRTNDRRIDQATQWLLGSQDATRNSSGLLERLRKNHRLELIGTVAKDSDQSKSALSQLLIWDSSSSQTLPNSDTILADGAVSPIGGAIADSIADKPAALLVLSDGQNNQGMSLEDASALAVSGGVPIFAIGFGNTSEPIDFGILQIEHSQRVFRTDRLRGIITIKERSPAGTSYRIVAEQAGVVVWSKELQSTQQGLRRVEFDMPAESLVDAAKAQQNDGIEYNALPLDLDFSIESDAEEVSLDNNTLSTSLWGIDHKNRVLVLDRRGGWETRYIKNALERDAAWDTTVAIGPAAFAKEFFPASRAALFDFDLVLLTVESLPNLNEQQRGWLEDFVGISGGGLVLLDSNRPTVTTEENPLKNLLPVEWKVDATAVALKSLHLSNTASDQPAFQLAATSETNETLWSQLPVPKSLRQVSLAPGAELLAEGISSADASAKLPVFSTKLFGQGRVFYSATDETWRWRYNVADLYHQRFWNQVAAWCMRAPFAVNDAFVSLDTGLRTVSTADTVTIRARIKQDDSQPLENATVQAILERDGVRESAIPLAEEPDARGFYRATVGPLPTGNYRVTLEVVGIPRDALQLASEFIVKPPIDIEMESLACNREQLEKIASATGGGFAMIDQAESIVEKLKPFQTGKIVETQTLLWQSYPWFVTIMLLLALEWYLRKRAGMI